ncbi:D-2-hydroxyacid dehydrogenase [Desmospora activa]|uniref:Phosphoglycerate dehydrogenase-like enzyme n=1 Tax=Desmospora activa DSM 45169 TaxID=1121389 RepID=A0A2T4Z3E2_9BACL|nr:D-2-hydroxyacid dehydrogenase [Desmospora activa]PTM56408.1 phosphoglycerate dehydrogenase-like enzyme [Desmospora activa DSM 45169]
MTLIVATAKIGEKHRQQLHHHFPGVRFLFCHDREQAQKEGTHADILVTFGGDVDKEWLTCFPALRWIHVLSAGVELLPFAALRQAGIRVSNSRGIHAVPMGEYTLAMMLQLTRRGHDLYRSQREKHWDRDIRVGELAGKTLAVIGAGAIGQGIAKRAHAFDMHVCGLNTSGHAVEHFDRMFAADQREELLTQADFVVVTLPLTDHTRRFIGERELRFMKRDAVLINIGRGSVIDESALLQALRERRIGGAVLDVFEQEPLPANHPFWELDNLLLTPHVSGRSPLYMQRALDIFQDNLSRYLNEETALQNEIDLDRGY